MAICFVRSRYDPILTFPLVLATDPFSGGHGRPAGNPASRFHMDLFPRSFLLVFAQFSVGGFLVLSIPPFHAIQRGYYKSSGFVYLLFGVLALVGRLALYLPSDEQGILQASELVAWGVFVAAGTAYWPSHSLSMRWKYAVKRCRSRR